MWNRRLELDCLTPLGHALRNKISFFQIGFWLVPETILNKVNDIVERGIEMSNLLLIE